MLDCWELVCQALLSDHNGLQKRNGGFIKPSPFEFLSFFLSPSLSITFSLSTKKIKLCLKFHVFTLKCGSRIFWIPFSIK